VSEVTAEDLLKRDTKSYESASGHPFLVAQVEVVGTGLLGRKDELLRVMRRERSSQGVLLYALMVTDVLSKSTDLLVAGDLQAVARAFGVQERDSALQLPGVMSRKKQVVPKLLSVL
jgi:manganese-dependent inorganic pyrophosphatase